MLWYLYSDITLKLTTVQVSLNFKKEILLDINPKLYNTVCVCVMYSFSIDIEFNNMESLTYFVAEDKRHVKQTSYWACSLRLECYLGHACSDWKSSRVNKSRGCWVCDWFSSILNFIFVLILWFNSDKIILWISV